MSAPRRTALAELEEALRRRADAPGSATPYWVPPRWTDAPKSARDPVRVAPASFYLEAVRMIGSRPAVHIPKASAEGWTRDAVVYNMLVRATTAFDHDRDGALATGTNAQGWRETGTFLKAIVLLPKLRSMGINTIHLLPVCAVGEDGKKGTLGSPYAMKNPMVVDPMLSEPVLGLDAERECAAFVEAAHRLGMRVVFEFVLRTASKDSDWIAEHPEWFYWIDRSVPDRTAGAPEARSYGPPVFTPEELDEIRAAVGAGRREGLVAPRASYRALFSPPPSRSKVRREGVGYVGHLPGSIEVRIPGAFADWPPDDIQPPWGDVTYLRMYAHPEFNYIAYNTIRMYDERLAQPFNAVTPLWEAVADIIPSYQRRFGIDGVMIDMGHALPMELKQEIVRRARRTDPSFAFWEENFVVSGASRADGYDAVIGYLWCDEHDPVKLRNLLRRHAQEGLALPYFATPESHNSPRAASRPGGTRYARYAWAVACFLPAIPFVHSGFELGEVVPMNTGLGFSSEELASYPAQALALFSARAFDWAAEGGLAEWVARVLRVRAEHTLMVTDRTPDSFRLLETGDGSGLAFLRCSPHRRERLLVAANSSMTEGVELIVTVEGCEGELSDLLEGRRVRAVGDKLALSLAPGEVLVFALP